ncbi:MAG: FABP family protein [Actinobacteria bacterium]|nr:FABP family protein [Actinomycetota bacterium]
MFVIPDDLPIELTPFAFLLGSWRGSGIVSYAVDDSPKEIEFFQTATFKPLELGKLEFFAEVTDSLGKLISQERGYLSISRPASESDSGPGLIPGDGTKLLTVREDLELWRNKNGGFDIEALIVSPQGVAELYFGQIKGARIDLATDAVLRSPNAKEYNAGTRLMGLVEGALLWAWDMAALGQPLKSHASARLEKIE